MGLSFAHIGGRARSSCIFGEASKRKPHVTSLPRNEIGIAPGLSVSIDVEFLTRKPYDYVDKLVITAEAASQRYI